MILQAEIKTTKSVRQKYAKCSMPLMFPLTRRVSENGRKIQCFRNYRNTLTGCLLSRNWLRSLDQDWAYSSCWAANASASPREGIMVSARELSPASPQTPAAALCQPR